MLAVGIVIALLPAVICSIILAALRSWRPHGDRHLPWAVPLAVGVGFAAAQMMVDGVPRVPPIEASGWFSIIAVVLTVLAIAVRPRVSGLLWAVVSTLVSLALVVAIVHPLVGQAWTWPVALAWITGMTAITATVGWVVDRRASAGPGAPAVFLVAATGVAAALALCGSARYGQLAGAIASVMGPVTLLGFVRREARLLVGAAWMSYLLLAMLIVAGSAYVDVPVFVGLLVALAPIGLLAGEIPQLQTGSFWKRDAARVVVAIAIVCIAIGAALASATDSAAY